MRTRSTTATVIRWIVKLERFIDGEGTLDDLSEGKAAALGGDRPAEFFGGFDPFLNNNFYVGQGFLVDLSVGGAAGKLGDFGDKRSLA